MPPKFHTANCHVCNCTRLPLPLWVGSLVPRLSAALQDCSLVPRLFPPPVFDRFQYEMRRGKAWEIWSRVVPSSRHMVDTRRAVPNEVSRHPVFYCPSRGWMSEHSQGGRSILFVVHNAGDRLMQNKTSTIVL